MTCGAFDFFLKKKYRYLRKTWTHDLGLVTVGSRVQQECRRFGQLLYFFPLFINGRLFLFYDKSVSCCGCRSYSQLLFMFYTFLLYCS